jgi:hypothetical protein
VATIYSIPLPTDPVVPMVLEVARRWHQRLHDAEVRIGVLFAANPDGPALRHGGDPVVALVRVLSLKWRVLTSHDALLEIDQTKWEDLDDDSRLALVDHELSHVDTVEKDGPMGGTVLQRDDIGRPKLRTVDGDWLGSDGFLHVIARHGEAALELINSRRVHSLAMAALRDALAEGDEEAESEDEGVL